MSSISNMGDSPINKNIDIYNPFVDQRRRRINVLLEMIKNNNIKTEREVLQYCLKNFGVRVETAKSYLNTIKADEEIKLG